MEKLEQFKILKSPLLKDWGEHFEMLEKRAKNKIKENLHNDIIITGGDYAGEIYCDQNIDDLFGLPYTSSSDFAGLWNTNAQAEIRHGQKLYFVGVACSVDFEAVLIFRDESEQYYYFYDWDFTIYIENEKKKHKAVEFAEFTKRANKTKREVIEILQKYTGKAYGEKTKNAIYNEISEKAQKNGCRAWLTVDYIQTLEITPLTSYTTKHIYYFDFLNEENKIFVSELPKNKKEVNGAKEFEKFKKQCAKVQEQSKKLLAEIEKLNGIARNINAEPKNTRSIFDVNLSGLANGNFEK